MSDSLNLPQTINGDSPASESRSNNNFISKLFNMAKQNGGSGCGPHDPEEDNNQRGGYNCNHPQHGAGGCGCGSNDDAKYYAKYMKYKAKLMNLKSQSGGSGSIKGGGVRGSSTKPTISLDECESNVRNLLLK